jgi:hypothetical protein
MLAVVLCVFIYIFFLFEMNDFKMYNPPLPSFDFDKQAARQNKISKKKKRKTTLSQKLTNIGLLLDDESRAIHRTLTGAHTRRATV